MQIIKLLWLKKNHSFNQIKRETVKVALKKKPQKKSDDPIRMYLREMGGVEVCYLEKLRLQLQRIEAGKDVMINALTQSPIVGKKINEWKELIENPAVIGQRYHRHEFNLRRF